MRDDLIKHPTFEIHNYKSYKLRFVYTIIIHVATTINRSYHGLRRCGIFMQEKWFCMWVF